MRVEEVEGYVGDRDQGDEADQHGGDVQGQLERALRPSPPPPWYHIMRETARGIAAGTSRTNIPRRKER
jgi:hypothetical protein